MIHPTGTLTEANTCADPVGRYSYYSYFFYSYFFYYYYYYYNDYYYYYYYYYYQHLRVDGLADACGWG